MSALFFKCVLDFIKQNIQGVQPTKSLFGFHPVDLRKIPSTRTINRGEAPEWCFPSNRLTSSLVGAHQSGFGQDMPLHDLHELLFVPFRAQPQDFIQRI